MEKTLVLIKPDGVENGHACAILARLEATGVKLAATRMLKISRETAEAHYAVHKERPFFASVVSYITSGPVVAAVFQGEDAVIKVRKAMGATDPAKAEVGTIRKDFAESIERNAIHGSDSPETAQFEIGLYFKPEDIFSY
ncbi:nucleoside-diphosphate kinase [Dehalogenimonas sp. THU2]|uniref:nucleoside-diphosphate kinase n=1 Tax=Dehalogenimonas sp. THU2 TaxID=3151121 RepID=UPI00321847EC